MRYRAFHVQFSLNGYRIFAGGYFPQFHLIVLLEYKKTLFDEASEITFFVELNDKIPYSAGTWKAAGIRHLQVRPEWCNAGVLAHEQAHCSYALLTEDEKLLFETAYNNAQPHPFIVLLHRVNTYMNQTDKLGRHVEGHAELYRYIGLEKLPVTLKRFYPKLI